MSLGYVNMIIGRGEIINNSFLSISIGPKVCSWTYLSADSKLDASSTQKTCLSNQPCIQFWLTNIAIIISNTLIHYMLLLSHSKKLCCNYV
jgi:hypothetical protein